VCASCLWFLRCFPAGCGICTLQVWLCQFGVCLGLCPGATGL
ncbi:hypothetical protein AVDCRST_MAG94-4825, partial [uncultured Leptolyngbya sp.]